MALFLIAAMQMGASQAATIGSQSSMLTVTETVQGSTYKTVAVQNPMSDVAGVRRPAANGGTKVNVATPPWSPWTGATTYSNDSGAQKSFGPYLRNNASTAANHVCNLLNSKVSRSHLALVTYYEPIKVNGNAAEIEGTLWVRDNCSYDFMGVKVVDSMERIIYAIYTQGAVEQGLPSGWTMPKPGQLRWEMFEVATNNSTATPTVVKVNGKTWHDDDYLCSNSDTTSLCPDHSNGPLGAWGYYDEPQNIKNSSGNMVYYHCKKSSTDVCNLFAPTNTTPSTDSSGNPVQAYEYVGRDQAVKDVLRPLMQKYNAQYTIFDYGRTVHPVYTTNSNGKTQAEVAVSVNSRVLTTGQRYFFISPGGGAKFTNAGKTGYLLDYTFNRSMIQQGKSGITTLQNTVEHKASPKKSYSKSVVPSSTSSTYYQSRIIDPFKTSQVYQWKNDTVNNLPQKDYVYVAPLTVK